MATINKWRRGTASQWARANTTLDLGEPGFEADTGKFKIGDGSQSWNALPYFIPGGGPPGPEGPPGPAGSGSGEVVFDGSATTTVDYIGLDGDKTYEFLIDGVLEQSSTARWIAILPNGTPGVNSAGNYMRTGLERSWTAADGSVSGPTQAFFFEHGFVLGSLPHTADQSILAKARVALAAGRPRVCHGELDAGSIGANVNEVSIHRAVSKWADTTTDVTHLVFDFGGGTFTGRITAQQI